ncbi:MAG: hypothetical protein C4288_00580 [Leptolyngbya sp. ERB_1_1]
MKIQSKRRSENDSDRSIPTTGTAIVTIAVPVATNEEAATTIALIFSVKTATVVMNEEAVVTTAIALVTTAPNLSVKTLP